MDSFDKNSDEHQHHQNHQQQSMSVDPPKAWPLSQDWQQHVGMNMSCCNSPDQVVPVLKEEEMMDHVELDQSHGPPSGRERWVLVPEIQKAHQDGLSTPAGSRLSMSDNQGRIGSLNMEDAQQVMQSIETPDPEYSYCPDHHPPEHSPEPNGDQNTCMVPNSQSLAIDNNLTFESHSATATITSAQYYYSNTFRPKLPPLPDNVCPSSDGNIQQYATAFNPTHSNTCPRQDLNAFSNISHHSNQLNLWNPSQPHANSLPSPRSLACTQDPSPKPSVDRQNITPTLQNSQSQLSYWPPVAHHNVSSSSSSTSSAPWPAHKLGSTEDINALRLADRALDRAKRRHQQRAESNQRRHSGADMSDISPASGGPSNSKRPADYDDSDDDHQNPSSSGAKMKLPRLGPSGDPRQFSKVIKTRLKSCTRTGQACDRCKVRKIRCDIVPDGCTQCNSLNIACFVTDRISGRTERRGYLEELERDKEGMTAYINDMRRLMAAKGIQVQPYISKAKKQNEKEDAVDSPNKNSPPKDPNQDYTQYGSLWTKDNSTVHLTPNFPRNLLPTRAGAANIDFGVDNRPHHSLNGTVINVMGTKIDTTLFEAPDMDEPSAATRGKAPLYNKSEQAFIQSAFGVNPPMQVELPPKADAVAYANWFFVMMGSYLPVLHKPTFMRTLHRLYDEPTWEPPIPELVHVHMVLAIIYYQFGVRNGEKPEERDSLNSLSNKHYHFSLSKVPDLLSSRQLSGVQALTLLASHARSFPKPGCCTMISNMAFHRAIELNMHREPSDEGRPVSTNLHNEMRKRTWWVLLAIQVASTHRRGRPMPITVEEFDVGFPLPVNDEALSEDGVDRSGEGGPFNWEVGMATFKIMPIMMEMYANLYSVRRDTTNYKKVMLALEAQLDRWENDLPESLRVDMEDVRNGNPALGVSELARLYTKTFGLELRIFLRNNSVNPSSDQDLINENTRICEESARDLLCTVQRVIALKSLDTTWTAMSIYAMALLSMLVAAWDRRHTTTREQFQVLQKEMKDWFDVMDELSRLIGSGAGIQAALGGITQRTLHWIGEDIDNAEQSQRERDAQASAAHPPAVRLKKEQSDPPSQMHSIPHSSALPAAAQLLPSQANGPPSRPYPQPMNNNHSYRPVSYHQPATNMGHPAYTNNSGMYFASNGAPHMASTGENHNSLMAFAQNGPDIWDRAAGNTWQDWSAAMATTNQDRYGATTLMHLQSTGQVAAGPRQVAVIPQHELASNSQWPLVMFDQSGVHHQQQHMNQHQ